MMCTVWSWSKPNSDGAVCCRRGQGRGVMGGRLEEWEGDLDADGGEGVGRHRPGVQGTSLQLLPTQQVRGGVCHQRLACLCGCGCR